MAHSVDPFAPPSIGTLGPALQWLLGIDGMTDREVMRRARTCGLVRERSGEMWSSDGASLDRLVRSATRMGGPVKSGAVLLGLGHMMARSHADSRMIGNRLQPLFRHATPLRVRRTVLREALLLSASEHRRPKGSLGTFYAMAELEVGNWTSVAHAFDVVRHGRPMGIGSAYGLRFVAQLLLRSMPSEMRWFAKEADRYGVLSPVVGTVVEACTCDRRDAEWALRTGIPYFVGLGASALFQRYGDGRVVSASHIDRRLFGAGVDTLGRAHVAASCLKETVHAWHRSKDVAPQARYEQVLIEQRPTSALGGERHASDHLERLAHTQRDGRARHYRVCWYLFDALDTAAALNTFSDDSAKAFERATVDTPEIRHRFAMAHPEGSARREALRIALRSFDREISFKTSAASGSDALPAVPVRAETAWWAARSQIALSRIDKTDPGHDAAKRVEKSEEAARELTMQPFAAVRFGERFQNALTRWALVLEFASIVALSARDKPLQRTVRLVLTSANRFLRVTRRTYRDSETMERLSLVIADVAAEGSRETRAAWVHDTAMPSFLRSLLIWSEPDQFGLSEEDAITALNEAQRAKGTASMRRNEGNLLIETLDRALGRSCRFGSIGSCEPLLRQYDELRSLQGLPVITSLSSEQLQAAVERRPEAASVVLSHPAWGQGRLAHALTSARA